MGVILSIDELEKLLSRKKKHDVGNVMDILPFTSRTSKEIRNQFNDLLGEFVRNMNGTEHVKPTKNRDELPFQENALIDRIKQYIDYDDAAEYDLERFLNGYLFGENNRINVIHPYLYNYLAPPSKDIFQKYSVFMRDVLVGEDPGIPSLFQKCQPEDILTEIVLENLELKSRKKTEPGYHPVLNVISRLYRDDLFYISHHRDYFLRSFPLLTHFYMFLYACQLLIKFDQFEEADYDTVSPLYFSLEWEALNKRRKAVDELQGYKYLKTRAKRLFVHVHTMSQLSRNVLNKGSDSKDNMIPFLNYKELNSLLNLNGEDTCTQFVADVGSWMQTYSKLFDRVTLPDSPTTISEAFQRLFKCVEMGTSTDTCEKYGKNIEELGRGVFLKNRGSLGQVLNMNHEMLVLLTAVCVRDERIPLNQLFEEFQKRGVVFDHHSKKNIISLFDSLNVLDKKSDSGDAQYVKPIL